MAIRGCGESSLSYWGLSAFATVQVSCDWGGGGFKSAHVIFEQHPNENYYQGR